MIERSTLFHNNGYVCLSDFSIRKHRLWLRLRRGVPILIKLYWIPCGESPPIVSFSQECLTIEK